MGDPLPPTQTASQKLLERRTGKPVWAPVSTLRAGVVQRLRGGRWCEGVAWCTTFHSCSKYSPSPSET